MQHCMPIICLSIDLCIWVHTNWIHSAFSAAHWIYISDVCARILTKYTLNLIKNSTAVLPFSTHTKFTFYSLALSFSLSLCSVKFINLIYYNNTYTLWQTCAMCILITQCSQPATGRWPVFNLFNIYEKWAVKISKMLTLSMSMCAAIQKRRRHFNRNKECRCERNEANAKTKQKKSAFGFAHHKGYIERFSGVLWRGSI